MDRRDFLKAAGAAAAIIGIPGTTLAGPSGLGDSEIEAKVAEVLGQMTLKEKVQQMSGWLMKDVLNAASIKGKRYTGYTPANSRLGVPALKCLDGPRGVGLFYKSTCFPVGAARGASWDPDLEERIGVAMGYETAAFEGNMLLAPCINILRHPSWGRAQETYGEDPHHMSLMGSANVRGIQKHVMACPKHFAVNNIDDSRFYVNAKVDERTLREIYLPHFKKCVEDGAASVMSAYNDLNGELCAHNDHLLRDILKGEWKFDGLVISDWVSAVEDTVEAANAGLDVEMPSPENFGSKLERAVKRGEVSEAVIDEAVTRILRQKFRFEVDSSNYDASMIAGTEHAGLAREAAHKSILLLKNEKSLLPLDANKIKKIALIGPFADVGNIGDKGSSRVTPPYTVTPLQGVTEKLGPGVEVIHDNGSSLSSAKKKAGESDAVILVVGLTAKEEKEGKDRLDLDLAEGQERLIKTVASANANSVVVLIGGSAITMGDWKDQVSAIVMSWYSGMEGGHALADVIFGDVNPSAKLPIAWPKSVSQLFEFDSKAKEVEIDQYHGYRYFDKNGLEPEFHFGFGLSYTEYEYANLRLDKKTMDKNGEIEARVDVTNAGKVAGEEIVQLYVGYNGSSVERVPRELKAFGKVALEPGQTRSVSLKVAAKDLAFYNVENGEWEVEEIDYFLWVGPSSNPDGLLAESFKVSG